MIGLYFVVGILWTWLTVFAWFKIGVNNMLNLLEKFLLIFGIILLWPISVIASVYVVIKGSD